MSRATEFLDPQLINHSKYEILKHLGAGTFGSVLHARNKSTGEEVAVKLIALGQKFYLKYVDREIMNHRQLEHPHIVGFKEVFLTARHLCIVMEYVGGGNLQEWVERHGKLPEWQARCFFQQIILAVLYIHKNLGIAHRDIKLGNILLNDKYQIPILKLCDFGYSKSMQVASLPKTRVGTAAYISPEIAKCSGTAAYDTEKADVWSSAVTLYCMLAGRYPFTGLSGRDVPLQRIRDLTPGDVEDALRKLQSFSASPGCIGLMRAMLTVDPAQRISLDGILQDDWFKQYLPDLSQIKSPTRQAVQREEEVLAVLADAGRRSEAARRGEPLPGEVDDGGDFDGFDDEGALEETLQEEGLGGGAGTSDELMYTSGGGGSNDTL